MREETARAVGDLKKNVLVIYFIFGSGIVVIIVK